MVSCCETYYPHAIPITFHVRSPLRACYFLANMFAPKQGRPRFRDRLFLPPSSSPFCPVDRYVPLPNLTQLGASNFKSPDCLAAICNLYRLEFQWQLGILIVFYMAYCIPGGSKEVRQKDATRTPSVFTEF